MQLTSVKGLPKSIIYEMLDEQERQGNIRNKNKLLETISNGGFAWAKSSKGSVYWYDIIENGKIPKDVTEDVAGYPIGIYRLLKKYSKFDFNCNSVKVDRLLDWESTIEGFDFWNRIDNGNFQPYYDKYEPIDKLKELTYKDFKEGDYIVVTEYLNSTNWGSHWFKPREVLKLGGSYWRGSLEKHFAAMTPEGNHSEMSYNFQVNYKLRHATPVEIVTSDWNTKDLELKDLKIGDSISFKTKSGKTRIFKGEVVSYKNKIGLISDCPLLSGIITTNSIKFKYGWKNINLYSKIDLDITNLNIVGNVASKDRWIDIMNVPIGTYISFIDSLGHTVKGKIITIGGKTKIALNKSFKEAYAYISEDYEYALLLTKENIELNSFKDFKIIEAPKKGSFKDITSSGELTFTYEGINYDGIVLNTKYNLTLFSNCMGVEGIKVNIVTKYKYSWVDVNFKNDFGFSNIKFTARDEKWLRMNYVIRKEEIVTTERIKVEQKAINSLSTSVKVNTNNDVVNSYVPGSLKTNNIHTMKWHQDFLLKEHLKAIIVKPKSTVNLSAMGILERLDANMHNRKEVKIRVKKSEKTEVKSKIINIYKR